MKEMEAEEERIATSTRQLETLFQATGTSVDNFFGALGGRLWASKMMLQPGMKPSGFIPGCS